MGAMVCDRGDCDNAMCDTMIDNKYICRECLDEFEHQHEVNAQVERPFHLWMADFREFVATKKNGRMVGRGTLAEFLKRVQR